MNCCAALFASMAHGHHRYRYKLPAFTSRVDGPCTRVVLTGAREHGLHCEQEQCIPILTDTHLPYSLPTTAVVVATATLAGQKQK